MTTVEKTALESLQNVTMDHLEKRDSLDPATPVEKPDGTTPPGQDWTEEEEAAVVKIIDWRTLPYLSVVFGLSLLDRSNIAAAYIAGMGKDLDLTTNNRYSISLLLFFITYALFELPSNLVIRRIGARWWLAFLITSWGVTVLATGFIHSWVPLAILRLLLGVFEAGLFPGAIFIISSWYRTYETASRVGIFFTASLLASSVNGMLAYGLSLIRAGPPGGTYTQGWRWIYIVEGAITIVAGLLAPVFLGDFPERARFLTDRQRHIATNRLGLERAGEEYQHPTLWQALKALCDWKVGFYCLQYYICSSSVYSMAFFMPIILRNGMGFSYMLSQVLSSPPYFFCCIMTLASGWLSDRYRVRWVFLCGQSLIGIIGLLIILYTTPPGVRYFGVFLAVYGTQANVPGTLAYGQNQTAFPHVKGILSAAMITAGAAGGITGSTIFQAKDMPLYLPGMWATIAMQFLYLFGTFAMSMHFKRQNRLADEGLIEDKLEGMPGFRYAP